MKIQLEVERFIYVAKASYALLARFCRKNNLRTLSGKFLHVKFCRPESFDFLCLCGIVIIWNQKNVLVPVSFKFWDPKIWVQSHPDVMDGNL